MKTILIFVTFLSLLLIFLQDWKYRRIHILLPLVLFGLSLQLIALPLSLKLKVIGINSVFFGLTFGLMVGYMSLKNKKLNNPFQNYFGLGDFLFYLAIAPFFELKNYIIYFAASMLFAIVLQHFLVKNDNSIPLAGFSALLLGAIIASDLLFNFYKLTLI